MRDLQSVMDFIRSTKLTIAPTKPEKCVEQGLDLLWMGEEIVDYIPDESGRTGAKYIYLLTNKHRLIVCIEETEEYSGLNIFKTTQLVHAAVEFDFKEMVPEKTKCYADKEPGFFGAKYEVLELYFAEKIDDRTAKIFTKAGKGEELYNKIMQYVEKCSAEPAQQESSSSNTDADIKQFREMFEAGIITKEEMMDLIKSALGK